MLSMHYDSQVLPKNDSSFINCFLHSAKVSLLLQIQNPVERLKRRLLQCRNGSVKALLKALCGNIKEIHFECFQDVYNGMEILEQKLPINLDIFSLDGSPEHRPSSLRMDYKANCVSLRLSPSFLSHPSTQGQS